MEKGSEQHHYLQVFIYGSAGKNLQVNFKLGVLGQFKGLTEIKHGLNFTFWTIFTNVTEGKQPLKNCKLQFCTVQPRPRIIQST